MTVLSRIFRALPALLIAGMMLGAPPEPALGQAMPARIPAALSVNPNIEIASAFVTLGDLFDNAGDKADIRVFRAPAPGQTGYIRASRVVEAAASHGLTWLNKRKIPRVNVARLSHFISPEDITASIRRQIMARSGTSDDGHLDLRFSRPPAPIHLPVSISSGFEVKQVRLDKISGRFSAVVETHAGNEAPSRQIVLTGLAVETIELPVLSRALGRGDIIRPGDLELRHVARAQAGGGAILRTADLIGMASRRNLRPGQPLGPRDVEKPRIIHRNDRVTIIYRTASITLTTQGHALDDGALGETIAVRNDRSKRIIQVVVTGPKTVSPAAAVTAPATTIKSASTLTAGN